MFDNVWRTVLFFIVGLILTVCSFVCYYGLELRGWLMALLCALDIGYLYLNAYVFLQFERRPWLKALLITLGYIVAFYLVVFFIFVVNGGVSLFFKGWKKPFILSIFIGPCLLMVIMLFGLIMMLVDKLYH